MVVSEMSPRHSEFLKKRDGANSVDYRQLFLPSRDLLVQASIGY